MSATLEKLFFELPITYKEALRNIQSNGLGIIFFIDENRKLIGSFSDGDSRRAILNEIILPSVIEKNSSFYNKNPNYLPYDCQINEISLYMAS